VAPFVFGFLAHHNLLQQSRDAAALGRPVLFVGVDLLQDIECTQTPEEVAHFVAVVGDHDEEGLVVGWTHIFLQLPGLVGFGVHNLAARQPGKLDRVTALGFILDVEEGFLCSLELLGAGQSNAIVPVEVIVIGHKRTDAIELNHHVFELACKEEAAGHALPPRDGVTLRSAGSDDFEQLLGYAHVFARVAVECVLTHDGHHCRFQHKFPSVNRLKVFYQVLGLQDFVVVYQVHNQILFRFLDFVDKRRQDLHGILAVSEYDQVVFYDVVFVEKVAATGFVKDVAQFSLGSLA